MTSRVSLRFKKQVKVSVEMEELEELTGGRMGKIHKRDENVVRPANRWTRDVHRFLHFIHNKGADFVPEPIGINNDNEEIISFMPGDVFNYPLPEELLKDTMLISAAQLLLKFHQYSEQYIPELTNHEQWMLPAVSPVEVLCHGDFAPYNVTVTGSEAVGMIDFDTLHPGPKMWDIAYAVYRWVPFNHPDSPGSQGSLQEQIRKTKLFLDAYGVNSECKQSFVRVLTERLGSLTDYMRREADSGNEDFQLHIASGHLQLYLDDIEYLKSNEQVIMSRIQ
jgi:thiamine kinase-like enzyme